MHLPNYLQKHLDVCDLTGDDTRHPTTPNILLDRYLAWCRQTDSDPATSIKAYHQRDRTSYEDTRRRAAYLANNGLADDAPPARIARAIRRAAREFDRTSTRVDLLNSVHLRLGDAERDAQAQAVYEAAVTEAAQAAEHWEAIQAQHPDLCQEYLDRERLDQIDNHVLPEARRELEHYTRPAQRRPDDPERKTQYAKTLQSVRTNRHALNAARATLKRRQAKLARQEGWAASAADEFDAAQIAHANGEITDEQYRRAEIHYEATGLRASQLRRPVSKAHERVQELAGRLARAQARLKSLDPDVDAPAPPSANLLDGLRRRVDALEAERAELMVALPWPPRILLAETRAPAWQYQPGALPPNVVAHIRDRYYLDAQGRVVSHRTDRPLACDNTTVKGQRVPVTELEKVLTPR